MKSRAGLKFPYPGAMVDPGAARRRRDSWRAFYRPASAVRGAEGEGGAVNGAAVIAGFDCL